MTRISQLIALPFLMKCSVHRKYMWNHSNRVIITVPLLLIVKKNTSLEKAGYFKISLKRFPFPSKGKKQENHICAHSHYCQWFFHSFIQMEQFGEERLRVSLGLLYSSMGRMICWKAGLWVPTSSEDPKIYESAHRHKYPWERVIVQRQSSSCNSPLCTLYSSRSEHGHHTTILQLKHMFFLILMWPRYEMLGSVKQNIGNRSVCELYRTPGLRAAQLPFFGVLGLTLLKWKLGKTHTQKSFLWIHHNCLKLDFHLKEGLETEVEEVKTNKYFSDLADLTEKRQCLIRPYRGSESGYF